MAIQSGKVSANPTPEKAPSAGDSAYSVTAGLDRRFMKEKRAVTSGLDGVAGNRNTQLLWQGVGRIFPGGERTPVAALCWTRGVDKHEARDRWIGWDDQSRRDQVSRIASLREIIIFDERYHNTAIMARIMKEATQVLRTHWKEEFGVEAVLAECVKCRVKVQGTAPYSDPVLPNWILLDPHPVKEGEEPPPSDSSNAIRVTELRRNARLFLAKRTSGNAAASMRSRGPFGKISVPSTRELKKLARSFSIDKPGEGWVVDPRGKQGREIPLAPLLAIYCLAFKSGYGSSDCVERVRLALSEAGKRALGLKGPPGNVSLPEAKKILAIVELLSSEDRRKMLDRFSVWWEGLEPRPHSNHSPDPGEQC